MIRGIAVLLCVGCASPATPAVKVEAVPARVDVPARVEPGPARVDVPAKVEPAKVEPSSVKQVGGGRCEPEPRAGTPCLAGDGYCVLSWGEPGGHSSALWCRGGTWQREEEVNLP